VGCSEFLNTCGARDYLKARRHGKPRRNAELEAPCARAVRGGWRLLSAPSHATVSVRATTRIQAERGLRASGRGGRARRSFVFGDAALTSHAQRAPASRTATQRGAARHTSVKRTRPRRRSPPPTSQGRSKGEAFAPPHGRAAASVFAAALIDRCEHHHILRTCLPRLFACDTPDQEPSNTLRFVPRAGTCPFA
jgi:hypothetical protein